MSRIGIASVLLLGSPSVVAEQQVSHVAKILTTGVQTSELENEVASVQDLNGIARIARGQREAAAAVGSVGAGRRTRVVVSHDMFASAKVGLDWPVIGATGTPLAAAYAAGCAADLTACLRVDVIPRPDAPGFIVAHGGSTEIAVFDATGRLTRTIDIRSPRFLRNGMPPGTGTEAQIKWGEENSTLWGLYAVDEIIAVVHAHHATKNWRRGQVVRFNVFVNLYSTEGERLMSDLRLPDLPVGQHGNSILVIDYGPAGRRPEAVEASLIEIPLRQSLGMVAQQ